MRLVRQRPDLILWLRTTHYSPHRLTFSVASSLGPERKRILLIQFSIFLFSNDGFEACVNHSGFERSLLLTFRFLQPAMQPGMRTRHGQPVMPPVSIELLYLYIIDFLGWPFGLNIGRARSVSVQVASRRGFFCVLQVTQLC